MLRRVCSIGAALLLSALAAKAQEFPSRPLTIVVPLAAGTGMDMLARFYGEELQRALGKPVVIENQPGAALMLAVQNVARSRPDGHTLVISTSGPLSVNPTLYKKVNYDADKDFVPIALYARTPFVLIASPELKASSLADYIKKGRESAARPLTYGTPGAGVLTLIMEVLKRDLQIKANNVPYRNSNQIVPDVVGGHIDSAMSEVGAAYPFIREGKAVGLGVTSSTRHPQLPEVQTFEEGAGMKGFEAVSWQVLLAPAATPRPVIERLHKEMSTIVGGAAFQSRVSAVGLLPLKPTSIEAMQKYLQSERERWGGLTEQFGLAGTM